MDLVALREQFNLMLLKTMSTDILQNSVFGWNGYGQTIFYICFIIALFQSFTKSESEMLSSWVKIVIASWFCLAILGHPAANWQRAFPFLSSSGGTLDIAVFNYAKKTFDDIGRHMSDSKGGPRALEKYTLALNDVMGIFSNAVMKCDPSDAKCIQEQVVGKVDSRTVDEPPKDDSWFKNPLTAIASMISDVITWAKSVATNPLMLLFPIFMVIIQVLRGVIEMFMLITFGMITAISLMLTKALCPLMVLPAYRDKIISMFRTTLSTSLYGFVSHLILWLSIIITESLYMTTGKFFISQLQSPSLGSGPAIYFLVITNFFSSLVILSMQAAAIAKIPKICKQIMNLSIDEIVNLGDTLLQAGMGFAKLAGALTVGVATGGAALAAGGLSAAGAAAGAGKMGSMLGGMGRGLGAVNNVAQRMGFDGFMPKGAGAGGGGGFKNPAAGLLGPSGGSGGSGGGDGDGGRSMALGNANAKSDGGSFLKKGGKKGGEIATGDDGEPESYVMDKETGELKKKQKGQGALASELGHLESKQKQQDGVLAADEAKEKRKLKMLDSTVGAMGDVFGGGKGLKGLMSQGAGIAMGGLDAGFGNSDGTAGFKDLAKNMNSDTAKARAHKMGEAMGSSIPGLGKMSAADRAAVSESAYSAIGEGPKEMSEGDEIAFQKLSTQVATGVASDDDRMKLMQMSNRFNLSAEQKETYKNVSSGDVRMSQMITQEETINQNLIQKMSEGKSKYQTQASYDKQMVEFQQRVESGMINMGAVSGNQSIRKNLKESAETNYQAAIGQLMSSHSANGGQLNENERQELKKIVENNTRNFIGDRTNIQNVDKLSGGTIDLSHLMQKKETSAGMLSNISKGMNDAIREASENADADSVPEKIKFFKVGYGDIEMSLDKNGQLDGFIAGGKAITSQADIDNLGFSEKSQVNAYMDAIKTYLQDFELREKFSEKEREILDQVVKKFAPGGN